MQVYRSTVARALVRLQNHFLILFFVVREEVGIVPRLRLDVQIARNSRYNQSAPRHALMKVF